jgi:capsular polysaccharide transport system permease protein
VSRTIQQALFKRGWKANLFLLVVVGSTLFSGLYYHFIAADQYVTEFRFNLRSASNPMPVSGAAGSGGGMTMSTINPAILWDSYALVQFIKSRDLVDKLEKKIGIRAIYSNSKADFLTRLDPRTSDENLTEYWRGVVDPFFDMNTQVISVKVRAFSPEESQSVAQNILAESEALVNTLSSRARDDALKYFTQEVSLAQKILSATNDALRQMRNQYGIINPERTAALIDTVQSEQNAKLVLLKAQYESTVHSVGHDSPLLPALKNQIAALEAQMYQNQAITPQSVDKNSVKLSKILGDYDDLLRTKALQEKALSGAQDSLQRARMDWNRQQIYLNAFVHPAKADSSTYPNRLRMVLIIFGFSLLAWMLISLVVHAVHDHL